MNCRDPDTRKAPALAPKGRDPEEKEKTLSNATRNPMDAAPFGGEARRTPTTRGGRAAGSPPGSALARFRADLPPAILAAFAAVFLGVLAADPALAQGTGGADSINNAITQVADTLSTLIVSLGGVALLVAVIVWLFSGSDERRRQAALRWIGSICVAIFVGLSVPTIVSFIQGVAGGGGGG